MSNDPNPPERRVRKGTTVTTSKGERFNPHLTFVGVLVPNCILRRREISHGAKLAYGVLCQRAGKDGKCFPGQKHIADELGVSVRQARSYLEELERVVLIGRKRVGLGRTNRYWFYRHPWMANGPFRRSVSADERCEFSLPDRNQSSAPDQLTSSDHDRKVTSVPQSYLDSERLDPTYLDSLPASPDVKVGVCGPADSNSSTAEQIYAAYPKQVARMAALNAIRRAVTKHPADFLLERTRLYAATYDGESRYIPNPAKWFADERFLDDPNTWRRGPVTDAKTPLPRQFRAEDYQRPVDQF